MTNTYEDYSRTVTENSYSKARTAVQHIKDAAPKSELSCCMFSLKYGIP